MSSVSEYPQALPEGTVLGGRYIIGRVLGQGGFGITYSANVHKTGEAVAIKEYFPEMLVARTGATLVTAAPGPRRENFREGMKLFLDEAKTLSRFNRDDGIVHIFSYFEENGTAYFAMELLQGTDLQNFIDLRGGRIKWNELKRLMLPVMNALAAVHARGIIHRDIKPENIFLSHNGAVKLIDFGSARYSIGEKSHSLEVMLTPGFAPKEQYSRNKKQDTYTDVYALAATIYYAVTGKIPPDSVDRDSQDELVPPGVLGADMTRPEELALLKALSVRPEDRFRTVTEFREALYGNSAQDGRESEKTPVQKQQSIQSDQRQEIIQSYSGSLGNSGQARRKSGSEKLIIAAVISALVLIAAVAVLIIIAAGSSGSTSGTPDSSSPPVTAVTTTAPLTPEPNAETTGDSGIKIITRTHNTEIIVL